MKSDNTLTIARGLSNIQLELLRNSANDDDRIVAGKLEKLRDEVWKIEKEDKNVLGRVVSVLGKKNTKSKEDIYKETLEDLTPKQKDIFLSSYARMGNLYELASLTARENYLAELRNNPDPKKVAPGGVEEFFSKNPDKSVSDMIEQLNQPVFEVIMTAHPTNVYSLDSMRAQRDIALALESGDLGRLKNKIQDYQNTPILNEKEGGIKNLTVHEETENTLYFMGNIYEDLPKVYDHYDHELREREKLGGKGQYNPLELNLKTRLGSWGSSGDKDGNANVTAETTLEAIALHTKAALQHYKNDMDKMRLTGALVGWKTEFTQKLDKLNGEDGLLKQIAKLNADAQETSRINNILISAENAVKTAEEEVEKAGGDEGKRSKAEKKLVDANKNLEIAKEKFDKEKDKRTQPEELNNRFDNLSKQLAEIRNGLDEKAFEKALSYEYETGENKQEALNLLRRVRVFGFNFGKIEYRETAEEYTRVVDALVPNYGDPPEARKERLTAILTDSAEHPAMLFETKKEKIISEGAGKKYDDKYDSMPIAYHTIKRMELARDFPDMIKDNVLAECGKIDEKELSKLNDEDKAKATQAQGVANLLEAQFLQMAVEKDGKRAKLGIVPLFEEPETMQYVGEIMGAAYKNDAYKKQMEMLQDENGNKQKTQQVMIAHSDNARRSGVQAARGYIHEAHKKLRSVGDENEIKTEFYEGGSISDAYRNGVRAISSNVNSFKIHDFAKFTFQGGDLPNYFNHPDSTERIFDRSIAHQASHLNKAANDNWYVDIESNSKNSMDGNGKITNNVIDDVAIEAMKRTFDDYKKHDFTEKNLATLAKLLDYEGWNQAANAGSRAPQRGGGGKEEKKEKLAFSSVDSNVVGRISCVPIDKIRTIGFSMVQQVGALLPTMIGSQNLEEYLNEAVKKKYDEIAARGANTKDEREFLKNLETKDGKLSPKQIHFIYEKSPAFRDGQDKASAGVAISDLDKTREIMKNHMRNYYLNNTDLFIGKTYDEKNRLATAKAEQAIDGYQYWKDVQETYKKSASLAYKANKGEYIAATPDSFGNLGNAQIAEKMREALENLKHDLNNKLGFRDFLLNMRINSDTMFNSGGGGEQSQGQLRENRLWAAAIQSVTHGRWLGASDPTFAKHMAANDNRQRASVGMIR